MGFWGRFTKPKAQLRFEGEKGEYVLGEPVRGFVHVRSDEPFDIEKITVGLVCRESVKKTRIVKRRRSEGYFKQEYWDSEKLVSDSVIVCGEKSVQPGLSKFPFVFQLSSVWRETYHSFDRNIKWILWTEMKVKGRRSIGGKAEVIVKKPSETVKEVREVVLIPCEYCGGLMPQTSIFCPTCVARRKR